MNIAAYRHIRFQAQQYTNDPRVRELKASLPFNKPRPGLKAKGTTLFKPEGYEWSFSTNSIGLRGPEIPPPAGDGDICVMCIGDSRTFGEGVSDDETYPAQLDGILRKKFPGVNVRVFNAGSPGMTSVEAVELFKRYWAAERVNYLVIWLGVNDYHKASAVVVNEATPGMNALRIILGRWNLYVLLDSSLRKNKNITRFFVEGVINPQGYKLGRDALIANIKWLAYTIERQDIAGPKKVIVIADPIPYESPSIECIRTTYPALEIFYGIDVLDAQEIFKAYRPSTEELDYFDKHLDWTRKIMTTLKIDSKYRSEIFPQYYLYIDPINHPNATGQKLIAEALAKKISNGR